MKKLYQPPQIIPVLICLHDILTESKQNPYEEQTPGANELDPDFLT